MGFTSVYRSLTEIFPQVDSRMLRAVAIEHPKDADEAASVVLSDILPSLPSHFSHVSTSKSSPSNNAEREVERGLQDIAASASGTIPLVIGPGHDSTSAPTTKPVSNGNWLTNIPPIFGPGNYRRDVEIEFVRSFEEDHGDLFFGKSVPILPKDGLTSSVVHAVVPQENLKPTRDFWQELGGGSHMTWNQADSITSVGSLNAAQKGSCFEVGTESTNDQASERSLVSVNGDNESVGAFRSSTHGCSVDHLEDIIQDAKTNKETLVALMDSVMNLMKEVELEEKDAEKSELEAAKGVLDTLEKVEEFKKMLKHAKEANDMHAGEVYGEKSILATEAKELENRLLNLSEEPTKSLAVLDEMRGTLEIRLAAALQMKKAAEKEKKAKEDSAVKALAEQEAIMEKVVQESKILQQEAEQNSKLREFLMDRGQVVDSLQGEISVICQDVKLLKEKFDNRVSTTKPVTSSLTSSCGSSSMRSLVLETPAEQLKGMLDTSSKKKSPEEEEEEEASSTMKKLKNDCRELLKDGWDIFEKEMVL